MILDAKKKKNYQEKFIKTILELKDIGGIMRLSKYVLIKLYKLLTNFSPMLQF